MKVGFVSLGCSKNLIDTEITIGHFKNNGYKITNNPKEADIIVINTCGFIDKAKEEAINTILEMSEYKQKRCKYLIVMGCLVQRYYNDLIKSLPEVNLFIPLNDYDKLWEKIKNLVKKNIIDKDERHIETKISKIKELPLPERQEFLDRVITTGDNYAYLKIGEGCSNKCTYCAIPYIRGPFVSRPMEDILEEAKMLSKKGIKELIVIAQDTTKYGLDLYGKPKLAELLEDLSKIRGIEWIRFLYSYPEGITENLIKVVKTNKKICKYFDIPIQHISNDVLKRMNRKTSKEKIESLISLIKKEIPDVVLRTSLIVGFPGEKKEDFNELYDFVCKTKFDRLGVFTYSREENTPAEKLPNQIHHLTKKARYNRIMKKQQEISNENLSRKIGKTFDILIENISFDKKYFIGRSMQDIPDEDGIVYVINDSKYEQKDIINSIKKCKILDINDYDLIAEII